MSNSYKSFAVIGAGGIGTPILEALLAKNVSVVVLTRSANKSLPSGAKSATVDYADVSAVAAVLKEHKVEVIISTIGGGGLEAQRVLADAAKLAGTVKVFAPSEFGMPTNGHKQGILLVKDQVAGKNMANTSSGTRSVLRMSRICLVSGAIHSAILCESS